MALSEAGKHSDATEPQQDPGVCHWTLCSVLYKQVKCINLQNDGLSC